MSTMKTLIVAALLVVVLLVVGYVYVGGASGDTHTHTSPAVTTVPTATP